MFNICFFDDFFYANSTADTVFFVNIDGTCFPDEHWTDFAISVLNSWIINIIENYNKKSIDFVFSFFDGPYYINCSKQDKTVHLTCIEDKKRQVVVCECDVNIDVVIQELVNVSLKIIQTVEEHNFGRLRDFDELKRSTKILEVGKRECGKNHSLIPRSKDNKNIDCYRLLGGEEMKLIDYFVLWSDLYEYKTIHDDYGHEFVVFKKTILDDIQRVNDKTEFEAVENHVHLFDNIRKDEFEVLNSISEAFGKSILHSLKYCYPQKQFIVYVTLLLHGSMIIRFHQKWSGEELYFNPADFTTPNEKVFLFEG